MKNHTRTINTLLWCSLGAYIAYIMLYAFMLAFELPIMAVFYAYLPDTVYIFPTADVIMTAGLFILYLVIFCFEKRSLSRGDYGRIWDIVGMIFYPVIYAVSSQIITLYQSITSGAGLDTLQHMANLNAVKAILKLPSSLLFAAGILLLTSCTMGWCYKKYVLEEEAFRVEEKTPVNEVSDLSENRA